MVAELIKADAHPAALPEFDHWCSPRFAPRSNSHPRPHSSFTVRDHSDLDHPGLNHLGLNHPDHYVAQTVQQLTLEFSLQHTRPPFSPHPSIIVPLTIPLYRLYSPGVVDHFYTTNAAERDNAIQHLGYNDEGVAAYVYATQVRGTIPLYRLYSPSANDHFYTANAQERDSATKSGFTVDGIAGYVYSKQICGSIPLFRLYSKGATDHFYTSDAGQRNTAAGSLGYVNEGVVGFVLPL